MGISLWLTFKSRWVRMILCFPKIALLHCFPPCSFETQKLETLAPTIRSRWFHLTIFVLPQFFCPKILAQNTESYNGKQYFKIRWSERTFKERSLEKLRFGIERARSWQAWRERSHAWLKKFSGTQRMTNVTYIIWKWTIWMGEIEAVDDNGHDSDSAMIGFVHAFSVTRMG